MVNCKWEEGSSCGLRNFIMNLKEHKQDSQRKEYKTLHPVHFHPRRSRAQYVSLRGACVTVILKRPEIPAI